MFAIQKTIDSKFRRQLAICSLSLCLAIPALCAAVSPAKPVRMSGIIDPPELPFPPPPPAHNQGAKAMEQTA